MPDILRLALPIVALYFGQLDFMRLSGTLQSYWSGMCMILFYRMHEEMSILCGSLSSFRPSVFHTAATAIIVVKVLLKSFQRL